MTDLRALANDAIQQLDRLGAVVLDDVGDGPSASALASAAGAARDAVAKLAVPALTQLSGLVASVADSLASGGVEWNPSLGGTLMAAVDDLRHLASEPARFTAEDGEHLHHRASELSPYAVPSPSSGTTPPRKASPVPEIPAAQPAQREPAPAPRTHSPDDASVVPISQLFYADGGPHIVTGGTPPSAAERSDLLGRGIEALDNLTGRPIATPASFGAMEVVPVETLLYRGRAALERAAALREQIKASGGVASTASLEEMYDLIGLALQD